MPFQHLKKSAKPHLAAFPHSLTPGQQIVLRVLVNGLSGGERIKTIKHNGRLCEVIRQSGPLREIQPWFESDGTPSDSDSYWTLAPGQKLSAPEQKPNVHQNILVPPIPPSDRKVLFRPPHWTGEPRPNAESRLLRTEFPPSDYLKYLVSELGYDKRAARAALPHLLLLSLNGSARRTKVGGAHKAETVTRIIGRHNWRDPYPNAVFRVLCKRQEPSEVAKELGVSRGTLYVYASQIRREIGREQTGETT